MQGEWRSECWGFFFFLSLLFFFLPLVCVYVVESCHVVLTRDVKIEAVGLRGAVALSGSWGVVLSWVFIGGRQTLVLGRVKV